LSNPDARRIAVVGMGAVTPLGNDLPTTWAGILAGRSGVGTITQFDPSDLRTRIAAEVKDFDPTRYVEVKEARRMDRFVHFAIAATQEAIADSGLDLSQEDPRRVGVLIGSAVGGIHVLLEQIETMQNKGTRRVSPFAITGLMLNAAAGQVSIMLGVRGPSIGLATACATGSHSLGEAAEIIRRGDADVMVAGGSEAGIVPIAIAAFDSMHAVSSRNDEPERASRPFDADRDGFVVGEGAGIMILERMDRARARGARIYAELLGYGATDDAFHIAQPAEGGEGAVESMRAALRAGNLRPEDVDYINAHGTSTRLNDAIETQAIKTVFGQHAYNLAVSSTKSMIGHLLGAAGAVEAIACAMAIHEQVLPPTINYETPDPDCDLDYVPNVARPAEVNVCLSNSFGLGGHNGTVALRRADSR
jgi:3-oxoacyl-[acyl-carrier-protein] synthase II